MLGDLATVCRLVYPARTKWYNIGLELQLPVDTLDAIERNKGDDGDHFRDMLKFWFKRTDPTPTSKALVDALNSRLVGESWLVCDLESNLHSLANPTRRPHSSDESRHSPLSTQYRWIKVVLVFALFLFALWCYTGNNNSYCNIVGRVKYYMNLLDSKSLPSIGHKIFIGRDASMNEIMQKIDYVKSYPPIISIVGPPGFGKSTLAIHIGHEMVADGVLVYYVDMTEVSSKQALAEKILAGDPGVVAIKSITTDRLYNWARNLHQRTLLILDNCDGILHNTTDLPTVIEELLDSSPRLKILITSRKSVLQENHFTYRLQNLSSEASCTVLQRVTDHEGLNSTTCKSIANLTGNVPLALQVVGAILNSATPPDLMTIIGDLEKDLIPTLSPEDLYPVEKRVNKSISLSYQYLTPHLQTIGRYIANFPGSFNKKAACSILFPITHNSAADSEVSNCLEKLVTRSLLEWDRRTDRYQFHKLIREFFLKVSKDSTGNNETKQFLISFQSFYTDVLQTLTEKFNGNHMKVLSELDTERHNILHLLECVGNLNPMTDVSGDLHAIHVVQSAVDNNFLSCRFTPRELIGPVGSMVEYLSQKLRLLLQQPISSTIISYFKNHVLMTIHLADLEEQINGVSKAVEILDSQKYIIDQMETYVQGQKSAEISSGLVSKNVILFYRRRSDYYSQLGEHDKVIECHEIILRRTEDLLKDCEPGKCQYADIGRAYYTARDYESSAEFIQSALDLESANLTVMVRADLMTYLYFSYSKIHNTVEAEKVLDGLSALLPDIKAENETELYQFNFVLKKLIEIYQQNSRFEEVRQLKDKLVQAVRQVGAKITKDTMETAGQLAVYFFSTNDYPRAANMAEFALQSFKHLDKDRLKWELTQLQLTVGMAKVRNWNLSEGLDYMELAVDYVCENMSFANPSFRDWQVTFYFAIYGHFCPLGNMLQTNVLPFGVRIVRRVFGILLDVNTVGKYSAQKPSQLRSHSTELVMATEGMCDMLKASVSHLFTSWLFYISILEVCILFIINVTYVMEKFIVVWDLAYYSWCCAANVVRYCRKVIKFVVYVVILHIVVHISDPVLSNVSHPRLFLCLQTVSASLLSIVAIWFSIIVFEINVLYVTVKLILPLCLVYLSWCCIHVHVANIVYYCKALNFVKFNFYLVIPYAQCGSVLFSVLQVFTLFTLLFLLIGTIMATVLLSSGVLLGIFIINVLYNCLFMFFVTYNNCVLVCQDL